jgi:hypothetical protein
VVNGSAVVAAADDDVDSVDAGLDVAGLMLAVS